MKNQETNPMETVRGLREKAFIQNPFNPPKDATNAEYTAEMESVKEKRFLSFMHDLAVVSDSEGWN